MAVWVSGWLYRKKITIDKTKVDADLIDFPVLVELTSTNFDFAKARSDGFDIRFTEDDGETLLKYERERHDQGNSLAEYWVKIPSVLAATDTEFYIYYGKADTSDGADPTNVWDANFKAVYHMKDITTSTIDDSTTVNDGTKAAANQPIEADGEVGKAQSFDGSDDYIEALDDDTLDFGSEVDFTISAWIKSADLGAYREILHKGESTGAGQYRLLMKDTGVISFSHRNTSGEASSLNGTDVLDDNTYHRVTVGRSGTTFYIYTDDTEDESATKVNTSCANVDKLRIGRLYEGGWYYPFNGIIDEVQISNTWRGADWIKASYNSESDNLVSYGNEEETYALVADYGGYALTGIDISVNRAYVLIAQVGSYVLNGIQVILKKTIFKKRTKPTTDFTERTKPETSWTKRSKPTTDWTE